MSKTAPGLFFDHKDRRGFYKFHDCLKKIREAYLRFHTTIPKITTIAPTSANTSGACWVGCRAGVVGAAGAWGVGLPASVTWNGIMVYVSLVYVASCAS